MATSFPDKQVRAAEKEHKVRVPDIWAPEKLNKVLKVKHIKTKNAEKRHSN